MGTGGTAAAFLSGCSLKCTFCQNYQISHLNFGRCASIVELASHLTRLCEQGACTVSFVTPDQFVPHLGEVVSTLREHGVEQPIVVNCSGYQSWDTLRMMDDWADVYLPDFKYADSALAASLASCPDYPGTALDAIGEMVRQKGFLTNGPDGVAVRGVLVRHLVLPGYVENSICALRMLVAEFGARLPLSLMSQYVPGRDRLPGALRRPLDPTEFSQVYHEAWGLGFELIYAQPPRWDRGRPRLPDFSKACPFPRTLW